MKRSWQVRAASGEFDVQIGAVDASACGDSRAALAQLLSHRGSRHVRQVLSEVHDALRAGLPGVVAGEGPMPERLVDRALESAARRGGLIVRLRPPEVRATPVQRMMPSRPRARTKKATWFSLTVLDEVGRAVPGVKIAFDATGERLVVPTDGSGVARLDEVEGVGTVGASLVSIAQAREVLSPRWKEPRSPNVPTGKNVFVRALREASGSLTLVGATPMKLVLTPYLECREIPGAHFDFGRSFARSGALGLLAGIAEELQGDESLKAMIFGHTDRAGSEALNKELSERRARALYALFTQDAGAWEELFSGAADGANWKEKWDVEEVQHMLDALGVTDDAGNALDEDGVRGPSTIQAIHRFQAGDYPDCPAEQAPLSPSDNLGVAGRKELFLAYAKRVSRKPLASSRFVTVGGSQFMGCGEYNPLSLTVRDAESRRAVVFLLDPAAGPPNAPCKLRSIGPCQSNCGPLPTKPDPSGKPPYRCKVYQAIAKKCPCQGGADLSHDLLVTVPMALANANGMPHIFVLESDDATVHQEQTLKSDARALDGDSCEVHFTSLPAVHQYRLSYNADGETSVLFDYTPYDDLPNIVIPGGLAGDHDAIAKRFASMNEGDDAFAAAVAPISDPNETDADGEGSAAAGTQSPAEASS